MNRAIVLASILLASPICADSTIKHSERGADYGQEGGHAYATMPRSFDREQFLDPCFLPFLEDVEGLTILDAGCGPAHWSIYAAQHGAKVYAIDLNEKMMQSAAEAVTKLNMVDKISLDVGDVAHLAYKSDMFDRAISINVAPNIPSASVVAHFQEMFRTLKDGGSAIITVPISLDKIFSNSTTDDKAVFAHIDQVLNEMRDNPSPADIYAHLMKLDDVLNATFIIKNGRLSLVTDKKELIKGQKIWRKLPVLVVPNYYHPEEEYLDVLSAVGFELEKVEHPHFASERERLAYNSRANPKAQFGPAYVEQGTYAVYHVKKKVSS